MNAIACLCSCFFAGLFVCLLFEMTQKYWKWFFQKKWSWRFRYWLLWFPSGHSVTTCNETDVTIAWAKLYELICTTIYSASCSVNVRSIIRRTLRMAFASRLRAQVRCTFRSPFLRPSWTWRMKVMIVRALYNVYSEKQFTNTNDSI